MILEVIITTMNDSILQLINDFFPAEQNVIFLISHQITKHKENIYQENIDAFLKDREDVKYIFFFEKGLSRNRNRSMEMSKSDFCMVTDDDIHFKKGAFQFILRSFMEFPNADIITFEIELPDGTTYKKYKSKIFLHTRLSCMRISSIEIAYKRESIEDVNLRWDEHFGLGGNPYTNHMENIFMTDALNLGLKCYFYPKVLVIHPFDNSGLNYSDHLVFSKGAAFKRMFGKKAFIVNLLFALKKWNYFKNQQSIMGYLKLSIAGMKDFIKQERKLYD